MPILTVGWTLIHEVYFYWVMAAAIAFLWERHLSQFLLAWASLVIIVYMLARDPAPWLSVMSSPMTLEFIAGALIALSWRRLPAWIAGWSLALGSLLFLLGMFVLDSLNQLDHAVAPRVLVFGSASAMIVLGAVAWERTHHLNLPRWATSLGDSSFSLYLSHVFVISAVGRMWRMTEFTHAPWHHAIFVCVSVAACIVVGLASCRWLERPLLTVGDDWIKRYAFNRATAA